MFSRFSAWLYRALCVFERPRTRWLVLLVAVVLVLPSVFTGLSLDDYILLYYRRPDAFGGLHQGPFNLFWFEVFDWLIDGFGLPWWSFEGARGRFMRPLTSLSHALDAALWPHAAAMMHAHSVLWFALVIALAAWLYRALHAPWVAGLAGAFFAFEDAHGLPVGWIANRNALIGAAGGFAALACHHRFRSRRGAAWLPAGALCFALGLLASELALGTAAYVFAYAVFLDAGRPGARAAALLPYVMVLAGWAIAYATLGFGTYGLGSYLDPIRNTSDFVSALPGRWVLLLSSQLSPLSADWWILVAPAWRAVFWLAALLLLGLAAWFVWPVLRMHRVCRFWACGAALSAVAATATLPNDRLLVFVGLGALAVVAQAVHDTLAAYGTRAGASLPRLRGVCASGFVVVHLCLAAVALPIRSLESWLPARVTQIADADVPKDPTIAGRTVVVPHVSASLAVGYLQVMRLYRGEPLPRRLYWLAATPRDVRIARTGSSTLRVEPVGGFYDGPLEQHYRSQDLPFRPGDRVTLSDMTVTVVSVTADGRPRVCDFAFTQPLESPKWLWLTWKHPDGLVPFTLPRIGGAVWSSIESDHEPR